MVAQEETTDETRALATIDRAPVATPEQWDKLEPIVKAGNLAHLSWEECWDYYQAVCEFAGLNPVSRPFDFIETKTRDGLRRALYPNKECAAQLIASRRITVSDPVLSELRGCAVASVRATLPNGASVGNVGVQSFANKSPENAIMHAATKAIRRAVVMVAGLGSLVQLDIDNPRGTVVMEVTEFGRDPEPRQLTATDDAPEELAPPTQKAPPQPSQSGEGIELEPIFTELATARGKGESWQRVLAAAAAALDIRTLKLSGSKVTGLSAEQRGRLVGEARDQLGTVLPAGREPEEPQPQPERDESGSELDVDRINALRAAYEPLAGGKGTWQHVLRITAAGKGIDATDVGRVSASDAQILIAAAGDLAAEPDIEEM